MKSVQVIELGPQNDNHIIVTSDLYTEIFIIIHKCSE